MSYSSGISWTLVTGLSVWIGSGAMATLEAYLHKMSTYLPVGPASMSMLTMQPICSDLLLSPTKTVGYR